MINRIAKWMNRETIENIYKPCPFCGRKERISTPVYLMFSFDVDKGQFSDEDYEYIQHEIQKLTILRDVLRTPGLNWDTNAGVEWEKIVSKIVSNLESKGVKQTGRVGK